MLHPAPPPWLLALAIAVRAACALLTLTYGPPDEHWQGPEVAHSLVFSLGARTWEWEPRAALRSFAHPVLLALLAYAPVAALEGALGAARLPPALARAVALRALWLAPRLVHAAATLLGDLAMYALAARLHGERAARCALLAQLCNFFSLYAAARPLANGLEAALCTLALLAWRSAADEAPAASASAAARGAAPAPSPAAMAAGALAGTALALRPTAALYLALMALAALPRVGLRGLLRLAGPAGAAPAAAAAILALCALDSALYGSATFPALNFFRANALEAVASLYGTHAGWWYLSSGLPMLMGAQLLPVLLSLCSLWGGGQGRGKGSQLGLSSGRWRAFEGLWIAGGVTLALSTVPHKEHRFLLPILPLLSIYAGHGLSLFLEADVGAAAAAAAAAAAQQPRRSAPPPPPPRKPPPRLRHALVLFCAATSIGVALYLCAVHQRGSVAVVEALAATAGGAAAAGSPMAVHFLTPCHATPLFAHLHYAVEARTLDCHPRAMGGRAGSGFLEACEREAEPGACCGEAWGGGRGGPRLWESRALELAPLALLRSVYGRAPLPPRACGVGQGAQVEAPPSGGGFLTVPALFVREFGGSARRGCSAAGGLGSAAPPAAGRRLPTHLVLHDVEARASGVAGWLAGQGFALAGSFPQGQLQGDAHLAPGRSPREVLLYVHSCWPRSLGQGGS